ncbi:MAG: C_GCAxxG_C_C family protein [Lachnospiraceae bacterium]|nr:C_GCAxxG_C_C family protein [Lachnospiraceae bacterium]
MTRTEILQELHNKRNCAMVTLGEYADLIGFDREETDSFALVFGGGMRKGNVCGAVTGAYMAIGSYFKERDKAEEVAEQFEQKFKEKHGTILCKELLGKDFSIPEERAEAFEKGLTDDKCPDFIATAIDILEELLV